MHNYNFYIFYTPNLLLLDHKSCCLELTGSPILMIEFAINEITSIIEVLNFSECDFDSHRLQNYYQMAWFVHGLLVLDLDLLHFEPELVNKNAYVYLSYLNKCFYLFGYYPIWQLLIEFTKVQKLFVITMKYSTQLYRI